MQELIDKAKILIEALPYIQQFYGRTMVIKYGGHAMVDEKLKRFFAQDIILLKYIGINPVVVHGGGPQIGRTLDQMGIKSNFVQGMRVTDQQTLDVVEMVLCGKINKEIVGLINSRGGKAVGLSGKDGRLIRAKKLEISSPQKSPEIIDIGRVGEVEEIDAEIILTLEKSGFIPVIAPLGIDEKEQTYNINADLVAGEIAKALTAQKLIILTDTPGVLDPHNRLISTLDSRHAQEMISQGSITEGMLPKVDCCLKALRGGVAKAHIIDGRLEHSLLLEIFTDQGIGTQIVLQ